MLAMTWKRIEMDVKKIIKFIGLIFMVIGIFNIFLCGISLFSLISSGLFKGIKVNLILDLAFNLSLIFSGVGLLANKNFAVGILYLAIAIFIGEGVIAGIYQQTYFLLIGNEYTIIGKSLIIAYLFFKTLFLPIITILFFLHPKIRSELYAANRINSPEHS